MMDIHTHILPGVDDGVNTYEEALEVLKYQLNSGVNKVVLTPHVNNSAQKVSSKTYANRFEIFKERILKDLPEIELYLGYEVKYAPFKETDYESLIFQGFKQKYLLIEFSVRGKEPVVDVIYNLIAKGITPIIAHIERYSYLEMEDVRRIKSYGALTQINSGAILGSDGKVYKKQANRYLKAGLIDFIASDCHNLEDRMPNLIKGLKKA